nr:hypothetical protein [Actinomyces culturomici]
MSTSTHVSVGKGLHESGSTSPPEGALRPLGPSAPGSDRVARGENLTPDAPMRSNIPRLTNTPERTPSRYSGSLGMPVVRTTEAGAAPVAVLSSTALSTSAPHTASKSRAVKFGGLRVAHAVDAATGASSRRNWTADRPPPTTRTRSSAKSCALTYCVVSRTRPRNESAPGIDGRYGRVHVPVALTIIRARRSPVSPVSARSHSISRRVSRRIPSGGRTAPASSIDEDPRTSGVASTAEERTERTRTGRTTARSKASS